MMNHPENNEPPFWPTAVILSVSVFVIVLVILGFDGIAQMWEMITN